MSSVEEGFVMKSKRVVVFALAAALGACGAQDVEVRDNTRFVHTGSYSVSEDADCSRGSIQITTKGMLVVQDGKPQSNASFDYYKSYVDTREDRFGSELEVAQHSTDSEYLLIVLNQSPQISASGDRDTIGMHIFERDTKMDVEEMTRAEAANPDRFLLLYRCKSSAPAA